MKPRELTAAHLGHTVTVGVQDEDGQYSECVKGILSTVEHHAGWSGVQGARVETKVVVRLASGQVEMDLSPIRGEFTVEDS